MAGSRIPVAVSGDASARYASVRALTLDAELSDLARLDFIKIDVEGHERQVLEGARKTLDRFRPMCVIEFNSYSMVYNEGTDPKAFLSYLQSLFPYVYHFDKSEYSIRDVRGREEAFHAINEKTGFVDDLVCAFGPVPHHRLHRDRPFRWFGR